MNPKVFRLLPALLATLTATGTAPVLAQSPAPEDDQAIRFFESRVRPLLVQNCFTCHSANTNSQGGLRVDDRNGLLTGGGRGPAIVPGKPDESLLVRAVRRTDEKLKMPPDSELSAEETDILVQWIAQGAVWTKIRVPEWIGRPNEEYDRLRREHWAWQPLADPVPPSVRDGAWALGDIDRFVLARLEDKGLAPVPEADRQTLIRRLSFDLTGLPPAPNEVEAFAADASPDAFESLVDRLLSSPAYAERWGRHWLDVARYGESTGSARNLPYPHAWRYRDYVIDAFRADKPYDQFLREQIAGDLLPAATPEDRATNLVATGFLALGVKDVNQRFKVRFIMDNIDEQIDTVTRAVLALSASCARCHDHKFDPIPTSDYYALAGIFQSTELCAGLRNKMGGGGLDYYDTDLLLRIGPEREPPAVLAGKAEAAQKALAEARAELKAVNESADADAKGPDGRPKRAAAREKVNRLQEELVALGDPAMQGPVALGVRESRQIGDAAIRIRGEAEALGPTVPRGFLGVLAAPDQPTISGGQSGRLELVQWLASAGNPLTPRVLVNRVWQHLFGRGLVQTVDNFGVTGDVPSHPELLDHLARKFVRDGWSIRKLIREIVLSRAYRLGSSATPAHLEADPANTLIWRHAPRRLDAEELRDALLAAAGSLDPSRPPGSPAGDYKVIEMSNNGPQAKQLADYALASRHRSVYLPLVRGLVPAALEVFDFAEQGMVTGQRAITTVAPQALYLLNDPFVRRESQALAGRVLAADGLDDRARVDRVYRLVLGRGARPAEIDRALEYTEIVERDLRVWQTLRDSLRPVPPALPEPDDAMAHRRVAAPGTHTNISEETLAILTSRQVEWPRDPRSAAWASFCQALVGSAEFQHLK